MKIPFLTKYLTGTFQKLWIYIAACLLLAASIFGGIILGKRLREQRQRLAASADMAVISEQAISKARKDFETPTGEIGKSVPLANALDIIGDVAQKYPQPDSTMVLALRDTLAELQPPQLLYDTALTDLWASGGVDPANLTTPADFERQREKIQAFSVANQQLIDTVNVLGESLQQRLDRSKTTSDHQKVAVDAFNRAFPLKLFLLCREDDHRCCEQMRSVLDLLEQSLGTWKVDLSGDVDFQKTADTLRYIDLTKTLEIIAKHQSGVQEGILRELERNNRSALER